MSSATPEQITFLSQLLFSSDSSALLPVADMKSCAELANKHHVVVRALSALPNTRAAENLCMMEWAAEVVAAEQKRISNALVFLSEICREFAAQGCDVTVIKSLDHWPDLGSDLDLYSNASPREVQHIFTHRFHARVAPRSWGDRLAGKWNFVIPGLPELVEVHVGRLGQTGEHVDWADALPERSVMVERGGHRFSVPAPEHRLMISTLQRMYRHFYFRLCDMLDSARLVESDTIDYGFLEDTSQAGGIWKGVATYLQIVSDYAARYRGWPLSLPRRVTEMASFGGEKLTVGKDFLRVPIFMESVALYASELTTLARQGEVPETLRLSLLPPLAAAATLGLKMTGSDKGIW